VTGEIEVRGKTWPSAALYTTDPTRSHSGLVGCLLLNRLSYDTIITTVDREMHKALYTCCYLPATQPRPFHYILVYTHKTGDHEAPKR
jgi:hypothetical protein